MQIPWRVSSVGSQEDCRVLKGSPCPQSQGKFQVSVCSLCAGIRVHRDSDVRLAAPQHQLQEEGAVSHFLQNMFAMPSCLWSMERVC